MRVAIRVIPRAGADRVRGERAGRLVVRVAAAPVAGAANRAAVAAVAAAVGIRASEIRVEHGATSRDKVLSLPAACAAAVARLMK